MKSKDLMYPAGKNDECYTPRYAVEPLLNYIAGHANNHMLQPEYREIVNHGSLEDHERIEKFKVWCPFDTKDSEFVKALKENFWEEIVIHSHISEGRDFFEYEPDEPWHMLISNPPFTGKRQIFERALSFGKPMALLMANTWLNDAASKTVFQNAGRNMELLMFDNRIRYTSPDGRPNNKITFSSSYFCSDFLPRDIVLGGKLEIA